MSQVDLDAPRLTALLARLRKRLVSSVWLHGLGTVLGVTAAWLLFAFLADWTLHVPAAVRLFHTAVLVLLPLYFVRRDIVRLLARVPGAAGLAQLIERHHPETTDLLVSAVQLAPRASGAENRELIESVVAEAEIRSERVDLERILDGRGPRRRLGAGFGALAATAIVLGLNPALTGIFVRRMFGADVAWPQRTHLRVEIPVVSDRAQVRETPTEILVRAARGSDIPVLVHVDGVIPSEVLLHFASGHKTPLPSGGTPLFRTLLRSVQEDKEFYVTGGDDRRGEPVVRVQVLQPPDVAALAFHVEPPAYSGLPARTVHGTDVQVLQGTRVSVFMLPDPLEAEGVARLLPSGEELALARARFPSADPASGTDAGEGSESLAKSPAEGLSFAFIADSSLRFRFELTDETGLPNPDPGLFGVQVVEDRRPEVVLLAPGRAEVDVVTGGAVPLHVRVEDDYGLADVRWDVRPAQDTEELAAEGVLTTRAVRPEPGEAPFATSRSVAVGRTRLEVADLGADGPPLEGQQLFLQVLATDNRSPEPGVSQSAPVRLRVVSGDEFLRRLKDSLARASEAAGKLSRLAEKEQVATLDVLSAVDPEVPDSDTSGEVSSLIHGARRLQGDARGLARDLAEVAASLLYSRVDARAGPLLEAIDEKLERYSDRSFHTEPWGELGRQYGAGQLGQADLAGDLVELAGMAVSLCDVEVAAAVDALVRAQEVDGGAATRAALTEATQAHERARETLDRLLVKLGEWDNFQSVLTLTRDILNRQKNLQQRTRKYAEDH